MCPLPKSLRDSHGRNDYNSITNHTYYGYIIALYSRRGGRGPLSFKHENVGHVRDFIFNPPLLATMTSSTCFMFMVIFFYLPCFEYPGFHFQLFDVAKSSHLNTVRPRLGNNKQGNPKAVC